MKTRWSKSPAASLVFIHAVVFLAVYLAPPMNIYLLSDPRGTLLVSQTIIEKGTVRLDDYPESVLKPFSWQIMERDGHTYYSYPLGTSFYAIPFVFIANRFGMDMADPETETAVQKFLSALTVAFAFLFIYHLARCYLPIGRSLLLTTLMVFGTAIAGTMGAALWNLNLTVLFELACLLLLARNAALSAPIHPYILGLCLFSAYFCRPTSSLFILCVFAYLLITKNYRSLIKCATISGILFFALVFYSQWEYHHFYPGNYHFPVILYSNFLLSALAGILISPSRGLFIFSPIFILTFAGSLYYFKALRGNPLFLTVISWFILHIYLISCWGMWWGGGSFGYRLLTDVLPALVLISILVVKQFPHQLTELYRPLRAAIILVGIFSIFVNTGQGLYNPSTANWIIYRNVHLNTQYMWDWRYPQFLATPASLEKRFREYIRIQQISLPVIPVYILGDDLNFYKNEPPLKCAVYGWSGLEPWGMWSDGREGHIYIQFEAIPRTDLILSADIIGFTGEAHPRQDINILANGSPVGRWVFTYGESERERKLLIPMKVFREETILKLTFEILNPQSPKNLGLWDDARLLGIGLKSLSIVKRLVE